MKLQHIILLSAALITCTISIPSKAQDTLIVHANRKGATISPTLYGIFFEEINHSGDGGLYAELVRNRSFEDLDSYPGWKVEKGKLYARPVTHHFTGATERRAFSWPSSPVPGWKLEVPHGASAQMGLTREQPRYTSSPTNLKLSFDKSTMAVQLINEGYWGMNIRHGQRYRLRLLIRTSKGYTGKITAKLLSPDGKVLATAPVSLKPTDQWQDIRLSIHALDTDSKAKLALAFEGEGNVWLDYVSLFPEDTYRQRPNGFRKDVAQMLADLHPAFVRWPGGSIVGGITLDNRFDWKKTLGDPASRSGEYLTWGYRCSYGMGYYEMLQFCEDIGAKAMYVCNVGLADLFRSGEASPADSIGFFVRDCLDAIEYALGDTSTRWGARRAADGHPAPFPLEYVEIGNEHWGAEYDRRFDIFYKTIKEKYPQLTLISNHPLWSTYGSKNTDMVDPHWYGTPEFFFRNTNLFDSVPRGRYGVYVGEWACNFGVGKGNMLAALAEAAFLTCMERNADLVQMTSFAPLLQNRHQRNWPVNLIWLDTDQVVGRSSYYVQQMAATHRPDYNVKFDYAGAAHPVKHEKGMIGFGSANTPLDITDIKITEKGKTILPDLSHGQERKGNWLVKGDTLTQTASRGSSLFVLSDVESNEFVLECKVRKSAFKEGIFLYYSLDDNAQKGFVYDIGCWNSSSISVEQLSKGHNIGAVGNAVPFIVNPQQWYNIKLVVTPENSTLFVDGKRMLSHRPMSMPKQFIAAGIDETNRQLILKVVNRDNKTYVPLIQLKGISSIKSLIQVTTLSALSDQDENSFENPKLIYPQESDFHTADPTSFQYEFKPYSYTILQINFK